MDKERLNSGVSRAEHFPRGRQIVALACFVVLGLWFLAHVVSTNAALAPDATVSLEPSTQTVDQGEHFTVDVMIDEYSDLGGYEFNLLVSDSSVVQGEDAEDGGLLESSGRTMILVEEGYNPLLNIDNGSPTGRVSFASYSAGDAAGPSGTDGKLATVQLKATDLHNTALDLGGVQIVDTQGSIQPLLPPIGGTVLVNTAVNGKFKEWCQPQGWFRRNMDPSEKHNPPGPGTVDCLDDGQIKTGPYAFKITGSPTKDKLLKQNIYVTGEAGETFKLSGWSYVTSDTGLGWQAYKLVVKVTYTDASTEIFQTAFSPVSEDWNTWQYREVEFTTAKPYEQFDVYVRFFRKPETAIAWFDDIRLVRQLP